MNISLLSRFGASSTGTGKTGNAHAAL